MIFNLAIIAIFAVSMNMLCEKIKLPGLLGMVITGIILGPFCLDFISPDLLKMSAELRTAALIVILIRAGLGINRDTMNKVGIPALKMSFIPGCVEGGVIILAARYLLGLPWLEAGMLGFIIAAVSPAVVVPQMLDLKAKGLGCNKEVPTLVLAGASLDDVFAITIFTMFLNLALRKSSNILIMLAKVPLGIVIGILMGAICGYFLIKIYKMIEMRDTVKVLIFIIGAVTLHEIETYKDIIPIASLLGIMAMGFIILEMDNDLAHRLASKFNKVWVFAEILLFVLIGAQVNITVAFKAGLAGAAIIAVGLIGRSIGVWLSLLGSDLNRRERLFCVFAYFPKATVQAAIGAIPLSYGIASGDIILAIAVLSIIFTAPLGAILIRSSAPRLLDKPE